MKKGLSALSVVVGIGMLTTVNAGISIYGSATGYQSNDKDWQSNTIDDIDGNGLGTDGYIFFGDFVAESANVAWGADPDITAISADLVTDVLPSYVTAASMGVDCNSKVGGYPGYEAIDNPLIGDGTDGVCGNIIVLQETEGRALDFTVDGLAAGTTIRVGVVTVLNDDTRARWDIPSIGLTDGSDTVYVTDLPNLSSSADTTGPGWVFFDIDRDGDYTVLLPPDADGIDPDHTGLGGVTFDSLDEPTPGATLQLSPGSLSLNLVAPETSTDGTITATYREGTSSSSDIQVISAVADTGFSASAVGSNLGLGNTSEDIAITFDNSGIGLENGESTNATLVVTWTEVGSGVTQTSEAELSVTYINEPSSLELLPATLSLLLPSSETSVEGAITAGFVAGTLSNGVEIISVVPADSDFSAGPTSFTLGADHADQAITVAYTNPGELSDPGDTAETTLVVTWTESGSGTTMTTEVAVSVAYTAIPANTLVAFDFDALSAPNNSAATVVSENMNAGAFTDHMGAAFVTSIGDNSGEDASGDLFGTTVAPEFEGCVGISVNDATTTNFAAAVAAGEYVSFTVTPMDGFVLNLTDLSFKASKTAVSSVDEYGVTLGDDVLIGGTVEPITTIGQETDYEGVLIDLSGAAFQNITETTEFRIYAWGRDTTSTGGTLAMIDKVVLKGAVVSGEIPPVSASVSGGSLIVSWETGAPYNVLTNVNLVLGEWGVSKIAVNSPVTNFIGSADQVFFKLEKSE